MKTQIEKIIDECESELDAEGNLCYEHATKLLEVAKKIRSLPSEIEISDKAKEYFHSLCINEKSYLYPTKGFISGANYIINLIDPNKSKYDSLNFAI